VLAITVAESVNQTTNGKFGSRILPLDEAHPHTALMGCEGIHVLGFFHFPGGIRYGVRTFARLGNEEMDRACSNPR
jgi:hypothetical protein